MTNPNPTPVIQPDSNTGKSSSKKTILIVVLLSLLVLVPLCIILLVVAIIAINPVEKIKIEPTQTVLPTEVPVTTSSIVDTIVPTTDPYLGWQSYESTLHGINFKYRLDFEVSDTNEALQIYKYMNDHRVIDISFHKTFDRDFYLSHNIRQEENDRVLQIGDSSYTTSNYFSVEGSPGPNPGEEWSVNWETDLIELPDYVILIQFSTDELLDSNKQILEQSAPSETDRNNVDLILKSLEFN